MLIVAAMLAFATASEVDADPYGPPPPPGSAAEVVRRLAFDQPGAEPAARRWIAAHPKALTADVAAITDTLCQGLKMRSKYRAAAATCAKTDTATGGPTFSQIVRHAPPLRARGSGRAKLSWNFAGSLSADVSARGVTQSWFLDTGAEITTIAQSTAEAFGVRMLPGEIQMQTSTNPVRVHVGMIDRLQIGGAVAENVPVVVLPDAMLTTNAGPPGGPPKPALIPGLVGLQVFTAFRRMAFADGMTELLLGDAAPRPSAAAPSIYWRGDGIGLPVEVGGAVLGFHLDSGANFTDLGPIGAAQLPAAEQAAGADRESRRGGAGGVVVDKVRTWPKVSVALDGVPVELTNIRMAPTRVGAGRLGTDAMRPLDSLVLDLEHMRMSVKPKS